MPDTVTSLLRQQWGNPSDILSLLLLIGGDIVQKAIAQLVGYTIQPFGRGRLSIGITPVAFSFGWVAYGFTNLLAVVGEKRLMPSTESPSIVVNCANGFTRLNQSWILARLLRDHETRYDVDSTNPPDGQLPSTSPKGRAESIRIDIFELAVPSKPSLDLVWWLGWVTILVQIAIALMPWILYDNWGIMLVVLPGNLLALLMGSLPQWREEKWAGPTLDSQNVTCLTRGNGHLQVMVFIGHKGCWNFESFATAVSIPRSETPFISFIFAVLWTCILISVSGLKENSWFLVGIGGIGMLQNIHAAGQARDPATSNLRLTKFSRMPTIIGKRQGFKDDPDSSVNLQEAELEVSELSEWTQSLEQPTGSDKIQMPKWLDTMDQKDGVPTWLEPLRDEPNEIVGVQGALKELEKWVPTAGLAMIQIFFPGSLRYEDHHIRDNVNKKFWKRAYHTKRARRLAEHKRQEMERNRRSKFGKIQKSFPIEQSEV